LKQEIQERADDYMMVLAYWKAGNSYLSAGGWQADSVLIGLSDYGFLPSVLCLPADSPLVLDNTLATSACNKRFNDSHPSSDKSHLLVS
jgi:hypothetical protein